MANTKWALDASHSELSFKIRHMMVSNVTGYFKKFDGSVETDGHDMTTAKVRFTADVHSITTNNEQRDAHLRNPDFFDADNHPEIVFESTSMEKTGIDEYKLHGNISMRGVTKPITLNVDLGGLVDQDPWGHTRAGFTVTGKVNRMDHGVSFGGVSDTGAIMLGHDVHISANVQFVKQQVAELVK